jgi:hypothetical protein
MFRPLSAQQQKKIYLYIYIYIYIYCKRSVEDNVEDNRQFHRRTAMYNYVQLCTAMYSYV